MLLFVAVVAVGSGLSLSGELLGRGFHTLWSFINGASGCAGMSFFCNIGPSVGFVFFCYCSWGFFGFVLLFC